MNVKILVIEDNESISDVICINLENAGYGYQAVYDGIEAEKILLENRNIDMVLLDIMLPGRDGFSLLELIREKQIPVICLTAVSDVDSRIKGLKGGAEDYVVKPFDIRELMIRIEKVMQRIRKPETFRIGSIIVNTTEHSVLKGREVIMLKPKEYDLLLYLYEHRGSAITREELLNSVWGESFIGESRTVDVHIGLLRKKLGLDSRIRTIPKVGYLLEVADEDK